MKDYIAYLRNDNKSPKTIQAYIQVIKEFQNWYTTTTGMEFVSDNITPLDVNDYLSWVKTNQKQSHQTVNKKIFALKSYFNYLVCENIIVINPTAKARARKISKLQLSPRWLTRREQARLIHCIGKNGNDTKKLRDIAIAQCMLQAGFRVFEVAAWMYGM
ncbi:tyrosine-type recombinase/integrase [Syntrophomonas palmitatica]|uniref:tyrosine-type recombinase/integrase n=1 Tax=Syntrophomonas palmitatica TaxID=402877 RepID=UPI0006D1E4BD|nr:site-specific integrase [Syntrophomonas palmitatica]